MNKLQRQIERELVRGLGRGRRRALIERLRGNPEQRRGWDRAIAAMRLLEQREVSRFEVDQVERWLFEDLDAEGITAPARSRGVGLWTSLAMAASLASAAAVLLWINHEDPPTTVAVVEQPDTGGDELIPRGRADARPLAIDLVCGQPARPAGTRGCEIDELLGFSVRLGDGLSSGHPPAQSPGPAQDALSPEAAASFARAPLLVSVFGIDDDGELLYYTPNPDEPARTRIALGDPWQALPLSVRLEVNHEPGRVRVFALASDIAIDVADLDALARELAPLPSPTVDDLPWHLRLSPHSRSRVCPEVDRCASAQTELRINPAGLED